MEAAELERLERIVRTLPCKEIAMERCDGVHGEIYFAYGCDETGQIHGYWGSCGIAGGPVEFPADQNFTQDQVRQVLVDAAHRGVSDMIEGGMVNGG